ncbi:uncharacterized protein F4807DRAFT_333422 [Annulohypoxylon truncatum]|uniref:uncharacterized protein n=1 Tax=Annulohypoxylon truncatum TaxID=327061 RepID=UPI0020079BB9|nr:uncharacterized protein F4807DRAFT_333422 [Annulohypoxylon truncatum]KAI1204431.1 hypothetical protein F4807DRAFT_333422 [Annulohypoxylon truncatum]
MKMFFAAIAFVPLLMGQGSAQILPCAAGCVSGVFSNAAGMGCAMNDILCVCGKSTDFTDGIRDCVNQACPAADVAAQLPLAQSAGTDQCKTASAAAATSTATPAQSQVTPPTQQAAASSPSSTGTEASAETATPGTTATSVSTTPISTPTAQTTEAAVSVASTDSSATSATSAADQSSPDSAASTMSSTTDSGAASGATAAADNSGNGSSSTSSDLSVAARAGIGAGSGVAAVLLGIIAYCLITRRRKQKKAAKKSMQISQPLPGSGRLYAGNMRQGDASLSKTFTPSPLSSKKSNQPAQRAPSPATPPYSPSVASSYDPELDLNARRYEDLTPRTQPRTMI